ncbi:hypothetical protein LY76DRAFT_594408 [Colletotrichum caudatum]|nr:hypothetical protein LY76DRAFT_594408 [Colletotrichum caudatum]
MSLPSQKSGDPALFLVLASTQLRRHHLAWSGLWGLKMIKGSRHRGHFEPTPARANFDRMRKTRGSSSGSSLK